VKLDRRLAAKAKDVNERRPVIMSLALLLQITGKKSMPLASISASIDAPTKHPYDHSQIIDVFLDYSTRLFQPRGRGRSCFVISELRFFGRYMPKSSRGPNIVD
jgi:hypothetical protein